MIEGYRFQRFLQDGDENYIATPALATAVNTALAAEQPLVVTGESGTGKTTLATAIANQLHYDEVLRFSTRSDHQGRDCLYTFDALRRLYDVQSKDDNAKDPSHYVRLEALGEAIAWKGPTPRVVLIDEIDKAPRDFPNDLLEAIDEMKFTVRETGVSYTCTHRPVVVITSNNERQLPDAFLRRCVFHHIDFPNPAQLEKIVHAHLHRLHEFDKRWAIDPATIEARFIHAAITRFQEIRKLVRAKPPATGELLAWVRVLLRAGIEAKQLAESSNADLHLGALVKLKSDLEDVLAADRAALDGRTPSRFQG